MCFRSLGWWIAALGAALGAGILSVVVVAGMARALPTDLEDAWGVRRFVHAQSAAPLLAASRLVRDAGLRERLRYEAWFAFAMAHDPDLGGRDRQVLDLWLEQGFDPRWAREAPLELSTEERDAAELLPLVVTPDVAARWRLAGFRALVRLADDPWGPDARLAAGCFRMAARAFVDPPEPPELADVLERAGVDGALAACPSDVLAEIAAARHRVRARHEEPCAPARTAPRRDRLGEAPEAVVEHPQPVGPRPGDDAVRVGWLARLAVERAWQDGAWNVAAAALARVPEGALGAAHRALLTAELALAGGDRAAAGRALDALDALTVEGRAAAVAHPLAGGFAARLARARTRAGCDALDELAAEMPAGLPPPTAERLTHPASWLEPGPDEPPPLCEYPPDRLAALGAAYAERGAPDAAGALIDRAVAAAPHDRRIGGQALTFYLAHGWRSR